MSNQKCDFKTWFSNQFWNRICFLTEVSTPVFCSACPEIRWPHFSPEISLRMCVGKGCLFSTGVPPRGEAYNFRGPSHNEHVSILKLALRFVWHSPGPRFFGTLTFLGYHFVFGNSFHFFQRNSTSKSFIGWMRFSLRTQENLINLGCWSENL